MILKRTSLLCQSFKLISQLKPIDMKFHTTSHERLGGRFGDGKSKFSLFRPFLKKSELQKKGKCLCLKCTMDLNAIEFMNFFKLPDTFYSWYMVVELHAWMLCVRLMQKTNDIDDGHFIRNYMIKSLWEECYNRMGELRINSKIKNNTIWDLSDEFKATILLYDDGILGNDARLANALWERIFAKQSNMDAKNLEILVAYVRRTLLMLEKMDNEELIHFIWSEIQTD